MSTKSEAKIIADGLKLIRKGLKSKEWEYVAEGFKVITGEEIEVESKLEAIRRMVKENDSDEDNQADVEISGNDNSGKVQLTVISEPLNEEELRKTKEFRKKHPRNKRPPTRPKVPATDGEIRFNGNPEPRKSS